jgi:hypothetical protein
MLNDARILSCLLVVIGLVLANLHFFHRKLPSTTATNGERVNRSAEKAPHLVSIPSIIFMTGGTLNEFAKRRVEHAKQMHPNFAVEFYDNARGEQFLKDQYGDSHVNTFRSLASGAHKADFLRYCLLFKLGGYYIDLDNLPLRPITTCLPSNYITKVDKNESSYLYPVDLVSYVFAAGHCGRACSQAARGYNFSHSWFAKECQPCSHVHNGFIITRAGTRVMQQLIEFIMENPNPTTNEWNTHPYHYYVQNFYMLLSNMTGETFIIPHKVYNTGVGESFLMLGAFPGDQNHSASCVRFGLKKGLLLHDFWAVYDVLKAWGWST